MDRENGRISINSENIFPIIKRWLYSDQDIFIRELVSNCMDAITKCRRLVSLGEIPAEEIDYRVDVTIDKDKGTIAFADNGIGMSADEVRTYINQVAFSSAAAFLEKYQEGEGQGIIGHFGMGFYSAFMAADKVEIETLSCVPDSVPVFWRCEGDTDYEMEDGTRSEHGTTVTLYLNEESKKYLTKYETLEVLDKYCAFLPYPIYLKDGSEKPDEEEKPINDVRPLWMRPASECTEEDYRDFYHKVFRDFNEPLFWVHLNADYPLRLQGILYFPKISHTAQTLEGTIKLYNSQVFVADNVQEVIPDYLMMLKGVVDCPDLPLNVSRSALQKDRDVARIPDFIARKVADRLISMEKNDREAYEKYWNDIRPFIEYGCLRDQKFYDRMREHLIFPLAGGGFTTLQDYLTKAIDAGHEKEVYYAQDGEAQAGYVSLYQKEGMQVLLMDIALDVPFMQFLEEKNEGVTFSRVDAKLPQKLKSEGEIDLSDQNALETAFRRAVGRDSLKVDLQPLREEEVPAVVQLDEEARRFQEMSVARGWSSGMEDFTLGQMRLCLNAASPVIRRIAELEREGKEQDELCRQIYDLARLSAGLMERKDMAEFLARSQRLLSHQLPEES